MKDRRDHLGIMADICNGQLYLVALYFVNKPVNPLLGERSTTEMLNDDCLEFCSE